MNVSRFPGRHGGHAFPRSLRGADGHTGRVGRRRDKGRGIVLVALILVFYLGWSFYSSLRNVSRDLQAKTVAARYGRVETVSPVIALIIREESVVVSPISGKLRILENEGARVRVGDPIAEVSNEEMKAVLEPRLQEIESERNQLNTLAHVEVSRVRGEIDKLKLDIEKEEDPGKKEELLRALAKTKADLEQMDGSFRDKARVLEAKEAGTRSLYKKSFYVIRTPKPGIVSFELDGFESLLRPDSPGDVLAAAVNSPVPGEILAVKDGEAVKSGNPVCKVISGFEAYVGLPLDDETVFRLQSRKSFTVRFPESGGETRASVLRIVDSGLGKKMALLSLSRHLDELDRLRKVKAEIVINALEGVVVPKESIVRFRGREVVYVMSGNGLRARTVSVKAVDGENAVVEGIKEGARVVVKPQLLGGFVP